MTEDDQLKCIEDNVDAFKNSRSLTIPDSWTPVVAEMCVGSKRRFE